MCYCVANLMLTFDCLTDDSWRRTETSSRIEGDEAMDSHFI